MQRRPVYAVSQAIVTAMVLLCLQCSQVFAQSTIERLLMPGPIAGAHEKLEVDCNNCHEPFSKGSQDALCLGCHKPVKADIAAATGFHGRSRLLRGVSCSHCHSDHLGRDADIVGLDAETFDHGVTDYRLTGAHQPVDCNSCHLKGKKFSEAPATCFGCHGNEQPHKGNLGQNCENCHTVSRWNAVAEFNHEKTTFPLRGKHAAVPCANCHIGEIYKGLPGRCDDCHAIQDVHERRFGDKCEFCHAQLGWKVDNFDHGKNTRFPLKGAHAAASCAECHRGQLTEKLSMACFDCHAQQDVHKAQLGRNCNDCHNEAAWRENVQFDHGSTNYPLIGLHAVAACEACHQSAAFKGAPIACIDCHRSEDAHEGRFAARCEDCHTPNGWQRVSFDHGKQTKFPLTGAHAKTGCHDCHRGKNVADARLPVACYACHRKQDVHRGAFGQDCARCHDTSTFATAFIRR